MKAARQQKYQRQAEGFLDPGERVVAATDGSSSPWAYWVVGAVVYLGIGRAVLVTDKKVYLCKRSAAGLGSVIARFPRNGVKLELQGHQLHVGNDQTIYVPPGRKQSATEVVQAANASG
jgi:hypothetical protein